MGLMATVADIEMFLSQGGYTVKCDKCGVKFVGERRALGEEHTRRLARKAGWTGPMTRDTDKDRCPECGPAG